MNVQQLEKKPEKKTAGKRGEKNSQPEIDIPEEMGKQKREKKGRDPEPHQEEATLLSYADCKKDWYMHPNESLSIAAMQQILGPNDFGNTHRNNISRRLNRHRTKIVAELVAREHGLARAEEKKICSTYFKLSLIIHLQIMGAERDTHFTRKDLLDATR